MEGREIEEKSVELKMEQVKSEWEDSNNTNNSQSDSDYKNSGDEGILMKDKEHKINKTVNSLSLPIRKSTRIRKKVIRGSEEDEESSTDDEHGQILKSRRMSTCPIITKAKTKVKQVESTSSNYSSDSTTNTDNDSQTSDSGSCNSASPPPPAMKLRGKKVSSGSKRTAQKFVCETCKKYFPSLPSLDNHTDKWHNPNYLNDLCTLCDKKFPNVTSFFVHYRGSHISKKDEEKTNCKISGVSINSFRMKKHMKLNHGNSWLLCSFCPKSFKSESGFRSHCLSMHSEHVKLKIPANSISTSDCSRCPSKFSTHDDLKAHVESVHPNNYFPCRFCKAFRYNKTTLQFHLSICGYGNRLAKREVLNEFNESESIRNYQMPCEICEKMVKLHNFEKHFREVHELTEDKKLTCVRCPKQFQMRLYLADHLDFVHGVEVDELPDGWCNLSLNDRSDEVLQKLKDKWKGLLITELDEGTRSRKYIKGRKRPITYTRRNTGEKKMINDEQQLEAPIICHICGASITKGHMNRHMASHGIDEVPNDQNGLLCSQCPRRFPKFWLLKKHCLKAHNEKTQLAGAHVYLPSNCSRCPAKFNDYSKLKSHVQSVHPNNYFLCQFCETFRYSKMTLKFHYKICNRASTVEQKEAYKNIDGQDLALYKIQCELCKKMITLQQFNPHLKNFHGLIEDEKIKCFHCSKQFHSRLYLADHMDLAHGVEVGKLPEGWTDIRLKDKDDAVLQTLKQKLVKRQYSHKIGETKVMESADKREKRLTRHAKFRLKRKLLTDNVPPEEIERQLNNLEKTYYLRNKYNTSQSSKNKRMQLQAAGMTRSQAKLALESPEERQKRLNYLRLACKKIKLKAQLVENGVQKEEIEKQMAQLVETFVPVKPKSAGYKPKPSRSSHFSTNVECIVSNVPNDGEMDIICEDKHSSQPPQSYHIDPDDFPLEVGIECEVKTSFTVATCTISLPPPQDEDRQSLSESVHPEEVCAPLYKNVSPTLPNHVTCDNTADINQELLSPPISPRFELIMEPTFTSPPFVSQPPPTLQADSISTSSSPPPPVTVKISTDGKFEEVHTTEVNLTTTTKCTIKLTDDEIVKPVRRKRRTVEVESSDIKLCKTRLKQMPNEVKVKQKSIARTLPNCSRCSTEFSSLANLKTHVETAHPDSFFPCPFCSAFRYNKMSLKNHLKLFCGSRVKGAEKQAAVNKLGDGPYLSNVKIPCEICGMQITLICFQKHVKRIHGVMEDAWKCFYCPKKFKNRLIFADHADFVHGIEVDKLSGEWSRINLKTDAVPVRRRRGAALAEDTEKGTQTQTICHICGISINSFRMKKHMEFKHGDSWLLCSYCPSRFKSESGLRSHCLSAHFESFTLKRHRNSISTSDCSRCSSKFSTHDDLKAHVESVHPNNYFPCRFCKAFRYNKTTLQFHLSICGYGNRLAKREVLNEFNESESIRNYQMPCEICEKIVKLHNFEKHFREVHEMTEDKKLTCFRCPKQFQMRLYLADHLDFVHGVEADKLPEGWCNLSLNDRSDDVIQGLKDKWKGLLTTELDEGTRSRKYIKGRKRPINFVKKLKDGQKVRNETDKR